MIEYFSNIVREPGFWALTALPAFGLINLAAALYLRPRRRRFLEIVEKMVADRRLTAADKALLKTEIDTSRAKHLLVASPFAPFAILGAIALGLFEGWNARKEGDDLLDIESQIAKLERSTENAHAARVRISHGTDPRSGTFWNDPMRRELQDLSHVIETWSHPVAMLWILLWLVIAMPLLAASYLISGSIRPFVTNLWEPIREPVLSALAYGAHRLPTR